MFVLVFALLWCDFCDLISEKGHNIDITSHLRSFVRLHSMWASCPPASTKSLYASSSFFILTTQKSSLESSHQCLLLVAPYPKSEDQNDTLAPRHDSRSSFSWKMKERTSKIGKEAKTNKGKSIPNRRNKTTNTSHIPTDHFKQTHPPRAT